MNLLNEALQILKDAGKSPEDIVFIGSEVSGHQCTFEEFCSLADIEYDDGFGAQKIATDLAIVFVDGSRLIRDEYDGSEGWQYIPAFKKPSESLPIFSLVVAEKDVGWVTLAEINKVQR